MAAAREKLLTASDLAALCEVDLKTIHNWVDRGRIPHFRTPGRHLRFRAADVAEFLRTWGYTVPRELAKLGSRSTLVVGPKETLAQVGRAVGEAAPLKHAEHPYDALILAGVEPPDVYLVDVRAVAPELDVVAMLEALYRGTFNAVLAAIVDDAQTPALPFFVQRIARADAQALRALIAPPEAAAAQPAAAAANQQEAAPASEAPARIAGGGSR